MDERRRRMREEFIDARGYWNAFWDGLLELDPDFFAAYLEFSGVLGQRDPGRLLTQVFDDLHKLMVEQRRTTVSVDFRALRFMNSSCFKYFAKWIKTNNSYPDPHAIHLGQRRATRIGFARSE